MRPLLTLAILAVTLAGTGSTTSRPGTLVPRDALARHRSDSRRTRPRAGRRRQPAQHLLRRLRQRRRLAIHRLRRQLGAAVRRPVDRLDRRDRRRPVEPRRHLRRHRRRHHPSRSRDRRRDVQVHRRRPHVAASRAARQPDDRGDRRRSGQRRPALRRRPRPSVRPQRGARRVPLHRRRTHLREGALQGRLHQRQRSAARSAQSQRRSTRRCGRSNRASSRARDSATPAWASSSRPTAARPGRSSATGCRRRCCRRTSRSRRAIRTSSTPPSRRSRGRSASTNPPTAARIGSRRFVAQGAPAGLAQDMRPLARIGGGDLPTVTVDPKDPNVVYTASTVMWRTMDGGLTWSAVRGAPGGDDYQRIWINPNDTADHPRRRRSGRGGLRQSRPQLEQLVQPEHRRRCITSPPTTRFPIASARDSRTRAAPACKADRTTAASRSTTGIR